MSDFSTMVDDSRTWSAIDSLLDSGLCEQNVIPMLRHISGLPEIHKSLVTETPEARTDRRRVMAHKIRALALELDADPDAKHYRVMDHKHLTQFRALDWRHPDGQIEHREYPTVATFLRDFAEVLAKSQSSRDAYNTWTVGKKTTRNDLPTFIRREIAQLLDEALAQPKKAPITPAMNLANALREGSATYEQMKDTFRHLRRHN